MRPTARSGDRAAETFRRPVVVSTNKRISHCQLASEARIPRMIPTWSQWHPLGQPEPTQLDTAVSGGINALEN
jgi:hypothetical protein